MAVKPDDNNRPPYDDVIQAIVDYVFDFQVTSPKAWKRARVALLDSLGCAIESVPVCTSFIGPVVKGTVVPHGFPLPGTSYVLDPLKAAFDLGSLIRYLDHSDAFPGAEWGHPSDNIGAILPVADWLSRQGDDTMTMQDVLEALIKAYEIQGCFQVRRLSVMSQCRSLGGVYVDAECLQQSWHRPRSPRQGHRGGGRFKADEPNTLTG